MITQQERREIDEEIKKAPTKKAAVIDVLKVVQKHRGWVTDNDIEEAAELLGMTPAEVDSVATFFSLIFRKPVGKHVILICDSVSCWRVGYEDIKSHLMKRLGISLGETTKDGLFSLQTARCIGACALAPAITIGDDVYGKLSPDKIPRFCQKDLKQYA
jgi:NADH-quinone oxidoreductase subunit E